MAAITTWKRFSTLPSWNLVTVIFSILVLQLVGTRDSYGQNLSELQVPTLARAAQIPPQWFGNSEPYRRAKGDQIRSAWYKAGEDTQRFRLINSDVVADLWANPDGRKRLTDQFELDTFLTLSVYISEDTVNFSTRLLSPDLKQTFLHEATTLSRLWFRNAAEEGIEKVLGELVAQMVNRLPLDAHITSVQENFLTLSAGRLQNLSKGAQLSIERSFITMNHPASGAWISYRNKHIGKAKVIEVMPNSAIAQLTQLVDRGIVKVGDGFRIDDLPSRMRFIAKKPSSPDPLSSRRGPVIVDIQPPNHSRLTDQIMEKFSGTAVRDTQKNYTPPPEKPAEKTPILTAEVTNSTDAEIQQEEQQEIQQLRPSYSTAKPEIVIDAGPRLWSVAGPQQLNTSASLPLWLANHINAAYKSPWGKDYTYTAFGNIDFGDTEDGGFFGFGFGGRFGYLISGLGGNESHLDLGLEAQYTTLGVSGGVYGGKDILQIMPYAHYKNGFHLDSIGRKIQYFAELGFTPDFLPLAFGQVGFSSSKNNVTKFSKWSLTAGASLAQPTNNWQWGGLIRIANDSFGTSPGTVTESDFYIGLLASKKY